MVQIDFFLEMPLKNVRPPTLNDPQWMRAKLYRADECYAILCYLDQIT